ncbi:MAG: AFG1 family ATPase [Caulobacteraceae bacterium]|nr:AFG1 family ATPase [Caulobacteraceae bacterium]
MTSRLQAAYAARVAAGDLASDEGQVRAVAALSRIEAELGRARGGVFRRPRPVRGAYIFGPVGRGKSMLMDLFFAVAPAAPKRREHFHAFMAEVHRLAQIWRGGDAEARRAAFGHASGDDPLRPLADHIAAGARLLCFDELQVTDIADAMILGRLFQALFDRGVTLVATSNRPPDDLYKDGINRQLFLPFIALLKDRLEIVPVAGVHDWRGDGARRRRSWLAPIDPDNEETFDALWLDELAGAPETGATLTVLGREQHWPRAAGSRLRAHFASLCGEALGPADYLAISARFHTLFIEAVPKMTPAARDQARRFATLVDTLYEARARLVVLAAGEPETLYPAGDGAFEFERTASRLREMRSEAWPPVAGALLASPTSAA